MGSYFDAVPNDPRRLIMERASFGYGFISLFEPINAQREITVYR